MIKQEGKLLVGVEHEGKRYYDFELHQKKIRYSVEAMEELGPDASQARLDIAVLSRQLAIPGIPQEAITTDFLLDMDDADMEVIDRAEADLRKKLIELRPASEPSAS